MPDFDAKKQQVRRELERMGYRNIPEDQLDEFTADLQRLMCHERGSRGSRSHPCTATSPSSRDDPDTYRGVPANSGRYYRPCSGGTSTSHRGSPSSPGGCSGCAGSQRSAPRRKPFRCEKGRRVELDETSAFSGSSPGESEFHNLRPEMASDGTPEYEDYDCEQTSEDCAPCQPACGGRERQMCARPFPRLHVSPVVPPEMLPPRALARPGFRVMAEMLARPIRTDPCTRMKWYSDYWSTLKIPGIYQHHSLMNAIRNMLDTYDYKPRPLNRREPVWNMSLLREQPTAMVKLNWC